MSSGLDYKLIIIEYFYKFIGSTLPLLYLIASVLLFLETIQILFFNVPIAWIYHFATILCMSGWLFSPGLVIINNKLQRIDTFYSKFSKSLKWWIELFSILLGMISLYILIHNAIMLEYNTNKNINLELSLTELQNKILLKWLLVIGLILFLIQLILSLHRHVKSTIIEHPGIYISISIIFLMLINHFLSFKFDIFFNQEKVYFFILGLFLTLIILTIIGVTLETVSLFISVVIAIITNGLNGIFVITSNLIEFFGNYALVAIPLFYLMATIFERGGIAKDLYHSVIFFFSKFRGDTILHTIILAFLLASMSGVLGSEIIMLGLVALPRLLKLKFGRKFSLGLICASGTLATIISPSIFIRIYGEVTGNLTVEYDYLFFAGLILGIILALFYGIYAFLCALICPNMIPKVTKNKLIFKNWKSISKYKLMIFSLYLLLIFGIFFSVIILSMSIGEVAAIGVIVSIVLVLLFKKNSWRIIWSASEKTTIAVGSFFWRLIGAYALVSVFKLTPSSEIIQEFILTKSSIPSCSILIMLLIIIILGAILDWLIILVLTTTICLPVVYELVPSLNYMMTDLEATVWFGVLIVIANQISLLSYPLARACFWLESVKPKNVTTKEINLSVLPFMGIHTIGLLFVLYKPKIVLFLPNYLFNIFQ